MGVRFWGYRRELQGTAPRTSQKQVAVAGGVSLPRTLAACPHPHAQTWANKEKEGWRMRRYDEVVC